MSAVPGLLSKDVREKIPTAKILVVGAGGIGCEILKNLALSGFSDIEIIDLDTIDVSNLNRQFLFRKEHVGKSKAMVTRESILSHNSKLNIKAYHDSITTQEYGLNFFKRFKVVLNALDNRAARNHVNRMCLAADIPLIESGTAGYSGQVEFIKKGVTQCYECQPKPSQKEFPGCTIRNTPSEPVHCIVWAKHLFNQLFGEDDPDQDVSPDTADPEAAGDGAGEGALATQITVDGNVKRKSTRQWALETDYDAQKLFTKFFEDDIKYLLSMENLWKTRKAPTPIVWADVPTQDACKSDQKNAPLKDMQVWTLSKCVQVFAASVATLKAALAAKAEGDYLIWDKDDAAPMDFVTACANIRSHIFSIEKKSRFDAKSIAGNIIPAIATTNAMIAGLVVLVAFRVLADDYERCQSIYLRQKSTASRNVLVADRALEPANPKCCVCSPQPQVTACVNVNKMTVKEFQTDILKKSLHMISPDALLDGKGLVVISSEEGETDANDDKTLSALGIVDGSILKVDDFLQNYELTVHVTHYEPKAKDDPEYKIVADPDDLKAKETTAEDNKNGAGAAAAAAAATNGTDDKKCAAGDMDVDSDDDLELIEDDSSSGDVEEEGGSARKRMKVSNDDDDDDVELIDESTIQLPY